MYTQLQPWSSVGAPPCMEQVVGEPIPPRIGQYYFKTKRPHPWRPVMAHEMIEINTLPEIPITNQFMAQKCSPEGMLTESIAFPNLVTGFDRNPQHAARAALYTRYTYPEWLKGTRSLYLEADGMRSQAEMMRSGTLDLLQKFDEETVQGQIDSGRRIGERISELKFWRGEVANELEKLLKLNSSLMELRSSIQKALTDLEGPLHIAQECLYHREGRKATELVHDDVEKCLLFEIENVMTCQKKLEEMLKRVTVKLKDSRAAQAMLEEDVAHKEGALGIDNACHQLNNYSAGINYYGGIEKYDPTISTADTWSEASASRVRRSQNERENGELLRTEANALINECASLVWDAWSATNNAINKRSEEQTDAKNKLLTQLSKTQRSVFDVQKYLSLLQKAMKDKSIVLQVAQTRHEARSHRNGIELCKDFAHLRLVKEIEDIQKAFTTLDEKLQETEAMHQQLLKTRTNLEKALKHKTDALFIDREKCMGLRRSFPVNNIIQY
ncbi:tektin-3-like [Culicoides brevitarsis]|uniref:tektin-3-like n=1 Tax=Culicoides brevitarsis TaxID=469753 RepID=UPI00307C7D91